MSIRETSGSTPRRTFLGRMGAGALGVFAIDLGVRPAAASEPGLGEPFVDDEEWLGRIRGKHKQVVDAVETNSGFAFAYAANFVAPHRQRGVPAKDVTAVVVLRHQAIPFGFTDPLWEKYKFAENMKIMNFATGQQATNNFVYKPSAPLPLPGMAIDELQAQGAVFLLCNVALTIASSQAAKATGQTAEAVKAEFVSHLIPGVTVVPSGVYAVNRAQEKGCTYCYGG